MTQPEPFTLLWDEARQVFVRGTSPEVRIDGGEAICGTCGAAFNRLAGAALDPEGRYHCRPCAGLTYPEPPEEVPWREHVRQALHGRLPEPPKSEAERAADRLTDSLDEALAALRKGDVATTLRLLAEAEVAAKALPRKGGA